MDSAQHERKEAMEELKLVKRRPKTEARIHKYLRRAQRMIQTTHHGYRIREEWMDGIRRNDYDEVVRMGLLGLAYLGKRRDLFKALAGFGQMVDARPKEDSTAILARLLRCPLDLAKYLAYWHYRGEGSSALAVSRRLAQSNSNHRQ